MVQLNIFSKIENAVNTFSIPEKNVFKNGWLSKIHIYFVE